jgi:hypothetical protein
MSTRYVIARHCFGGIGDHLSCLVGAWWLAKRTARALVVDWRGSRFNSDPDMHRNCFYEYFEPRGKLAGVEIIADDSVGSLPYPQPFWPEKWTASLLASPHHVKHSGSEIAAVNHLVTSNDDPIEPTLVLNQWVEPPPPRQAVREFLDELQPVDSIRAEAGKFWNEHIGARPAIAIHIRHGNGENVGARAAYWLGPIALIRQLAMNARSNMHTTGLFGAFSDNMPPSLVGTPGQAGAERRFCRSVASQFRHLSHTAGLRDAVPFLFCDAAHVVETMREALPSIVVLPKQLLGGGTGPLHQFRADAVQYGEHDSIKSGTISENITRDMFVELELMRRCSALLYMDSGFSLLARISLDENRVSRLRPNLANRSITRIMARMA